MTQSPLLPNPIRPYNNRPSPPRHFSFSLSLFTPLHFFSRQPYVALPVTPYPTVLNKNKSSASLFFLPSLFSSSSNRLFYPFHFAFLPATLSIFFLHSLMRSIHSETPLPDPCKPSTSESYISYTMHPQIQRCIPSSYFAICFFLVRFTPLFACAALQNLIKDISSSLVFTDQISPHASPSWSKEGFFAPCSSAFSRFLCFCPLPCLSNDLFDH